MLMAAFKESDEDIGSAAETKSKFRRGGSHAVSKIVEGDGGFGAYQAWQGLNSTI